MLVCAMVLRTDCGLFWHAEAGLEQQSSPVEGKLWTDWKDKISKMEEIERDDWSISMTMWYAQQSE